MSKPVEQYLTDLQQQVALEASAEGREQTLAAAFTEHALDILADAGDVDSAIPAMFEKHGSRASAYEVAEDTGTLQVFLTDYRSAPELTSMTKADLTTHFKRLRKFVEESSESLWQEIEESSPAWEMARTIADLWSSIVEIRLTILTNAQRRSDVPPVEPLLDRPVHHEVWDIDRLHKLVSSGRAQEPISVDLTEMWGAGIPCLGPHGEHGSYEAFLITLPGELLAKIYDVHGPRLLELNVRSFLQSRGKVNRGIQETIKSEPERFLAYNNGVSMTASSVSVETTPTGSQITAIQDLQIVNGGQTTASLHYAMVKGEADLSRIWVQGKLSVVEPSQLADLVPRISQFANSQNRVNMADFTANDPFHVAVEQLSRTVWAPSQGGSQMTRWFYERARGQYADAHARERTPARQRDFKKLHPLNQKFTKTDLAKFENTWDQMPWRVAFGAERNFREFMLRLEERRGIKPDQIYFERLIAKAIMFRRAEKLIGALGLGGYRAQTVTYTLAKLSNVTGQRIDLAGIWRAQDISPALAADIEELGELVHQRLITSAGTRNVSEWAKKEACWKEILNLAWEPSAATKGDLVVAGQRTRTKGDSSVDELLSSEEQEASEAVQRVSGDTWFALSSWAKETGNLQSWQRGLAFSLGKLINAGREPSRKQAIQGHKILQEATRLGFQA